MKKLGIWLALFTVTTLGIIAGWNWNWLQNQPQVLNATYRYNPSKVESSDLLEPPIEPPVVAPTVNADRLMADLEALTFQRFLEGDRRRAQTYISNALQSAGWDVQTQVFDGGINVYAERPGTNPETGAVLLGAHYDTVELSPGADDNSTAVAVVLEAARLLGNLSTPRTLKLALFDAEEAGLIGSFAFAADDTKLQSLQGAIIIDMIGFACHTDGCQNYPALLPFTPSTTQGNFLAVIGDQGHMPLIDAFPKATSAGSPLVLTLPVPLLGPFTPDLLRSDHAPFWQKGIGAVLLTDTANFRNPNYHQPSDTLDTIDRPFFTGSAQLVINAITALLSNQDGLATAPSIPQRSNPVPIQTAPL